MKTTVYSAKSNRGLIDELKQMFRDLWASKDLGRRIFLRDTKAEYRQSLIGILWAFITPLMNALVWIFLNATGAINVATDNIPYTLFVFLGTMIWSIFTESINMPLSATNGAKALISKINFPKEAILISGFYKILLNTSIKLVIVGIALIVFGINPGFNVLLGLLMILFVILFGISLGLIVTPVGMLYKDIGRIIPLFLSFLMYTTPIVYQNMNMGKLNTLIQYNPLTPVINSTRNLFTGYSWDNPTYLLVIAICSLVIMLLGWIFYRVSIPIIVERM